MEYIDYIGKLNEHDNYIKMLNILEIKCDYIEYVIITNRKNDKLLDEFKNDIICKDKTRIWCGTKTTPACLRYKIKSSKELFEYLKQFETFVKYIIKEGYPDKCIYTDFGINDIAFFDDKKDALLFTTTHEGYITVRSDIDNKFKRN